MRTRLPWLLSAATITYATSAIFQLWLQYLPTPPEAAVNVLFGVLAGVLFVFFSGGQRLSPHEQLFSLALNALVGMILFGAFVLLATQGTDWRPALAVLPRGAAFGAVMWVMGLAALAVRSASEWWRLAGVLVSVAVIIASPWLAVRLFDGGSLLVVAVAARLTGTAALAPLPLTRQALAFGVVVGVLLVALPGIGWFAGGYF